MTATAKQIGYIHALAGKAGMDDDTRRDFLERETGARSTKQISERQAAAVTDKLRALTAGKTAGAVAGLDSPVAGKLRALWIAAYDLGLVRERSDRAMLSFLERQAGVSHTRFLREPGQATAAIEALKDWLKRDGKVKWPGGGGGVIASKRAVVEAQWLKLVAIGTVTVLDAGKPLAGLDHYAAKVTWKHGWQFYEPADLDRVQNALGRKLRAALNSDVQR